MRTTSHRRGGGMFYCTSNAALMELVPIKKPVISSGISSDLNSLDSLNELL